MCGGQIVGELRDQQSSLGRGKGWEERVTQETREQRSSWREVECVDRGGSLVW